jgi:hypothetical protein
MLPGNPGMAHHGNGIDQGRELRHCREIGTLHSDFFCADKNWSETPLFTGIARNLKSAKYFRKIRPTKN